MKRESVKKLSLSAMFMAIGLVLPFLTGQIPEIGNMLLPMHLPVMLCGVICGGAWGGSIGFLLPLVRSLIFGRPILYPSAIAMAAELAAYGAIIGFAFLRSRHRCIWSLYRALILSMLGGRLIWGAAMAALMGFGSEGFTFSAFIMGAVLDAIPGIIIQLVLVPGIVVTLGKARLVPFTHVLGGRKPKITFEDKIVQAARTIFHKKGRAIIAIDGRCAAGKTTLAEKIAAILGATVFHMDDFFLPREMRTDGRLSEPGGNVHRERFFAEVLEPLSRGEKISYRSYDCSSGTLGESVDINVGSFAVIEGSYSCHPDLIGYYDLTVFLDVDKDTQRRRVIFREGEERSAAFFEKWIPLEEKYFNTFDIKKKCDIKRED